MRYIAYYRVSTKRQGVSGLGLEAQKTAVKNFIGSEDIIKEFIEVESGKNDNRQELNKAIECTKEFGGKLVIAKLDRLSRNASFIFALKDSGIEFVCADMPEANTLTIGIFATLAQYERELISQRTIKALAEKKRQGFVLGNPENLTEEARQKGVKVRQEKARTNKNNLQATELICLYRQNEVSYSQIVKKLNDADYKTSRGGIFSKSSVKMLFDRAMKVASIAKF